MTLVEGIAGELRPVTPDLLQRVLPVAVLSSPSEELDLESLHLLLELLPHRLTELVRLSTGEVGDLTGEEHHLLLIDGDPIGILEVTLHAGEVVGDLLASVLTIDEVGDVVHRPGAVEGIHRDQILEGRGQELTEVLLHPCRLELEGTHRPSRLIEFIGLRVGQRDLVDIDLLPVTLLDIGQSLLDHREGLESEEVHLDQPRGLDHRALILGHQ